MRVGGYHRKSTIIRIMMVRTRGFSLEGFELSLIFEKSILSFFEDVMVAMLVSLHVGGRTVVLFRSVCSFLLGEFF